jgi:hypothetical protein
MWHTVFISVHAITGGVALLAGGVAHRGRVLFDLYLWSLVASIGFLVAAVIEGWARSDGGARLLFGAFAVLGGVMIALAASARRLEPSPAYVDRVGFTLVALFDAFIVITVLNLGAPIALVVGSGVVVAIGGHFVLRAAKAGLAPARA